MDKTVHETFYYVPENSDYHNLCHLVEEMTTTGQKELNEKHLKLLKKIVKRSHQNVNHTFRLLMTQLSKFHAEIRFSTFQIINQLFERSHLFRKLLVEDFHHFLELTVEINKDNELPPPYSVAMDLKNLAFKSIAKWDEKFGEAYQKLHLGCNYLHRVKTFHFAGINSQSDLERRQYEAEAKRQEEVMRKKVRLVKQKMEDIQGEIEACITQAETCFRLLVPDHFQMCDNLTFPENNRINNEAINSASTVDIQRKFVAKDVLEHGIDCGTNLGIRSRTYKISVNIPLTKLMVTEDPDNTDILKALSEAHNEIVKHHLPIVKQWVVVLSKGRNEHQSLQKAMEIKNKLRQVIDKYSELNIVTGKKEEPTLLVARDLVLSDEEDSEEEQFEDVPEVLCSTDGYSLHSLEAAQEIEKGSDRLTSNLNEIKHNLPGPSGIQGSKTCHPRQELQFSGTRSESVQNSMNLDETLSDSDSEQTPWSCRTPLPNGLLCQRKDRVKCPFHGKIIPRNEFGQPTNVEDIEKESERQKRDERKTLVELSRDIQIAKGLGARDDETRRKGLKSARYSRLTDLKQMKNTPRNRLEGKILNKKALKRLADDMDGLANRRNLEKYGCNFNYR